MDGINQGNESFIQRKRRKSKFKILKRKITLTELNYKIEGRIIKN